ncbi:squalene synthetase-like protein [Botryosphaeria dothidea]
MWSSDVKLRHKGISFVSAGNLAGTLPEEPRSDESPPAQSSTHVPNSNEPRSKQDEPFAEAIARSETAMAQMHLEPTVEASPSPPPAALFFEDTTGSSALAATKMPPPIVRNTSPTPSDSSEEVVLFRGRNNVRTVTDLIQPTGPNASASVQSASRSPARPNIRRTANTPETANIAKTGKTSSHHSNPFGGRLHASSEPDDEAIADYIENVQAQEYDDAGEQTSQTLYETSTLTRRTLGLTDSDGWDDVVDQTSGQDRGSNKNPHKSDWDSPQLEAFDNISTSSEMLGSIDRILRKRERSSGIQYLVVFENSNEDEARWIPVSRLTDTQDKELVVAFEETVANVKFGNEGDSESWSDASEGDEDEEEDEDDDDELDLEDEEDLIQRKIERMSDEKIARLLAKQEELGMDSAELLLFDGDDEDLDLDGLDDELQGLMPQRTRGRKQTSKAAQGRDSFPSASLMADVLDQDPYNGFDIMDFERPSLKKKKKGRAAELPFELSDDELVAQLVNSWENDRSKKRLKKQERVELRSQGLLGKKNKFKPDLNAKYNEGMSFVQIREEIKVFLISPAESRPFPPMDKRDRAALHQLAGSLGLNSRSIGSGTSRFTTLIKTSRTRGFDEISFAKITSRYQNRFLQRMDKRGAGRKTVVGGGGGKYSGVSYRDGDVVGGSAPEIGSDNKGRAMLEKMGWSSGTALGAMNNKGILQPVTHVVKTTKTGLG